MSLNPHIFGTGAYAFKRLQDRQVCQAVLISGESAKRSLKKNGVRNYETTCGTCCSEFVIILGKDQDKQLHGLELLRN